MTHDYNGLRSTREDDVANAALSARPVEANATDVRVCLVDDDPAVLRGLVRLLEAAGFTARAYLSAETLLQDVQHIRPSCVIADLRLPGIDGLGLQQALSMAGFPVPMVFISGANDVRSSVRAMRGGAVDFLTKPFTEDELLDALRRALLRARELVERTATAAVFEDHLASLTARERQVFALLIEGLMNKQIAWQLGIAEKTVKIHRARIMRKMEVRSLAQLARTAERFGAFGDASAGCRPATKVVLPPGNGCRINGLYERSRRADRDSGRRQCGPPRPV